MEAALRPGRDGRQPAATLRALPRIGGMGSIPGRAANLPAVLGLVMPQLDRLHLFLHGYDEIPQAARHPRIIAYLMPKSHPYRESGKFYGLSQEPAPCLYFCFDDDILYQPGHVERLARAIAAHGGRAIVGTHAVCFTGPASSYIRGHRSHHFRRGLWWERRVDELGTGTIGFVSTLMRLDPPGWPYGDMDDLMLAIEAERDGIPRICVARPPRSAVPVGPLGPDSLHHRARANESRQVAQFQVLLELMGRRHAP